MGRRPARAIDMHADRVSKREIERFCCQKETHFVNVNVDIVTSIGESAPSLAQPTFWLSESFAL